MAFCEICVREEFDIGSLCGNCIEGLNEWIAEKEALDVITFGRNSA